MYLTFTPQILPLLLTALIGFALANYAWQQRRTPGALGFMGLGLSIVLLSLPEALALAVAEPAHKILILQLAYPGLILAPTAWLAFIVRYTGAVRGRSWLMLALCVEPVIMLALAATNDVHGLIWQSVAYDPIQAGQGVVGIDGPAQVVMVWYAYGTEVLGIAILGWKLHRRRSLPWRQIGGMGLAVAVAAIGESGLLARFVGQFDSAPYVLCSSCVALYWGFMRYRLLELGSVARGAVFDGMGNGVLVLDVFGNVAEVNAIAADVLGLGRHALRGQSLSRVIVGGPAGSLQQIIDRGAGELALRGDGGSPERYYDVQVSGLKRGSQELPGRLVILSDITERRAADMALRRSEERFRLQYRVSPIPTYCFRRVADDFVLEDNNAAAEALTGVRLEAGDLRGKLARDLLKTVDGMEADLERCWAERSTTRREVRVQLPGGGAMDLDVSLAFVPPDLVMLHAADVTASKAAQQALEYQALHDALTGLPNRVLLNQWLRDAVDRAEGNQRHFALLMLDLDRFKEVNDTLGHPTGDLLLVQVSALIVQTLSDVGSTRAAQPALVARLGGDEFAAIVEDVDVTGAQRVADALLDALRVPLLVDGHAVSAEASIGISLWPDHAVEPAVLMRRADVAMYAAKRGRLGSSLYSAEHDHHEPERLELVTELRAALEHDQLRLHFQPLVELASRQIVGVEALVRWEHPRRGLVPPDQFIGIAEQTGLIRPLSQWVLNAALAAASTWHARGLRVPVSVNLSAWDLHDLDLPSRVATLLATHALAADALRIEITESSLMIDPERACGILEALRRLGVRCSVDDFGTGYSSLSYLKRLPVDSLKIDRSFVHAMVVDGGDRAIVRSTIELAHNLGLQVVAEGVEDDLTARLLTELGCDRAQGYFFGRPQPRFEPWLDEPSGLIRLGTPRQLPDGIAPLQAA